MKLTIYLILVITWLLPPRVGDCPCSIEAKPAAAVNAPSELFPGAPEHVAEFFEQYLPEARILSMHYRVPATIILAVAALESGYGQGDSRVVRECHNFFNIKTWESADPTCCQPDDGLYGQAPEMFCFRKYAKPEDSFWDFCRLMHKPRYRHLTDLPRWDYRVWTAGLRQAGYATDPEYVKKLILIIEKYGLCRFDPMPVPHPYCRY